MLDTNVIGYLARGTSVNLKNRIYQEAPDNLVLNSIVYAEIEYGLKKRNAHEIAKKVHAFIDKIQIVNFDINAANVYAQIRATLEESGTPLDNMDLLIAACAISSGATLVSHNIKHYSKIKGLKVEDWY
jgi:tRNA(fMet)-specific endonuclease VapC